MAPAAVRSPERKVASSPSRHGAPPVAAQRRAADAVRASCLGRAVGGQAEPAGYSAVGHTPILLSGHGDDVSPRLVAPDDAMYVGSHLLAQGGHGIEGEGSEERFCNEGPVVGSVGLPARNSATASETALPFAVLVTRMEGAVVQASLLLNDRLSTLHLRGQRATFSEGQVGELCEITYAVSTVAYHLQKWAALLAPEEFCKKPSKPFHCEAKDEAFALMHCAAPRIIVAVAGACKGLKKQVEDEGDKAEATVNRIGVPTKDIRALVPHFEATIFRLSRLSSRLVIPRQGTVVVEQAHDEHRDGVPDMQAMAQAPESAADAH